jgi:pimeloyl-ACP methyl ester carboxylesterase
MASVRFSGVAAAILACILLFYATATVAGERVVVGPVPVQLYVEEAGRGPPLVLIHGLGGSSYSWRRLIPSLARTHRVYAIDLKGFGRSDKPFDTNYGPDDQALLIAALMRQRRLVGATVAGHSYGGTVALSLAIVQPTPRACRSNKRF